MSHKLLAKAKRQRTEKEKLELFVSKANELRNTRLFKNGFKIQHRIYNQQDQTGETTLEEPDEADLKDYLVTFRHFIAKKEDTFINNIFSICHRKLTNNDMKQSLIKARESLRQAERFNIISFRLNGEELTPEKATDMYLNSKYFHNDLEPQEQLDEMSPLMYDMTRFSFLNFVITASKIIVYTQHTIICAFKDDLFLFEHE